MAEFTEYITTEGQRWDTIAWKAYGNAAEYIRIVLANPKVAMYRKLPGGLRLKIPVIERETVLIDSALLPPWKQ
jgi:phage tail protein X